MEKKSPDKIKREQAMEEQTHSEIKQPNFLYLFFSISFSESTHKNAGGGGP
jgi:hypothetical protein